MECPLCGTIPNDPYPFEPMSGCRHEVSFVRDITVEEVLEAAMDLLNAKNHLKERSRQRGLLYNGSEKN
jgi:hypothetical protein